VVQKRLDMLLWVDASLNEVSSLSQLLRCTTEIRHRSAEGGAGGRRLGWSARCMLVINERGLSGLGILDCVVVAFMGSRGHRRKTSLV